MFNLYMQWNSLATYMKDIVRVKFNFLLFVEASTTQTIILVIGHCRDNFARLFFKKNRIHFHIYQPIFNLASRESETKTVQNILRLKEEV